MSIDIMVEVWKSAPVSGAKLLILLALADMANDEGYCWPSMDTLAKRARIGRRHVINIIEYLETAELIKRRHRIDPKGDLTSNLYQVIVRIQNPDLTEENIPGVVKPSSPPLESGSDLQFTTGSDLQTTRVVNPSSQNPSINPHSEPPEIEERENIKFRQLQAALETMIGCLMTPMDINAVDELVSLGATREDIAAALQFYKDNNKVLRTIRQIVPSVKYAINKRVQASNAKPQKPIIESKHSTPIYGPVDCEEPALEDIVEAGEVAEEQEKADLAEIFRQIASQPGIPSWQVLRHPAMRGKEIYQVLADLEQAGYHVEARLGQLYPAEELVG